jgi:hypothetical protein
VGGKSSTIATEEPRLGNLRVQTSMYGLAQPMVWGQTRVTGNLLWFGNFRAVATSTTTQQGGKGGGGVTQIDTKYTYYAAAMLGIARGPIVGIASAWKGKRRYYGAIVPGRSIIKSYDFIVPPGNSSTTVPVAGTFDGTQSVTDLQPSTDYDGSYQGGL